MRFATQCLLTIIGILRQVFVSSRYRWKKDIVELCAKPQKRHKSNKLTYSQRFQYCPQNFGRPSLVPPLFEIQNRHWVEAVFFLWKRKRENYIASTSTQVIFRGGARHFYLGRPLEGPVLQQGELSMVCVGLSERDLQKETYFLGGQAKFWEGSGPPGTPLAPPLVICLEE